MGYTDKTERVWEFSAFVEIQGQSYCSIYREWIYKSTCRLGEPMIEKITGHNILNISQSNKFLCFWS